MTKLHIHLLPIIIFLPYTVNDKTEKFHNHCSEQDPKFKYVPHEDWYGYYCIKDGDNFAQIGFWNNITVT